MSDDVRNEMAEAIKAMTAAVNACNVISLFAQQKYGTYVVTGADVHRCDEAVKTAMSNKIVADAMLAAREVKP